MLHLSFLHLQGEPFIGLFQTGVGGQDLGLNPHTGGPYLEFQGLLTEAHILFLEESIDVGVDTHPHTPQMGDHPIGSRLTIEQMHVVGQGVQGSQVVFDDQHRLTILGQLPHHLHRVETLPNVQPAGGFVEVVKISIP